MNEDSRFTRNKDGVDTSSLTAQENEELDKLQQRLAELRRQGILIASYGPCKPIRPVARVPGGLARFLTERDQD